eukprot:8844466-Lingulodinium_polyedra.AAC.1
MVALGKAEEGVVLADVRLREARDEVEAADAALARLLAQATGPEEKQCSRYLVIAFRLVISFVGPPGVEG